MSPMNRRHFIGAAASSLLIPLGITSAEAGPAAAASTRPDYLFYDDRFVAARQLAAGVSPGTHLTAVQGDVTDIWNAGLDRACATTALTLQGVTTESFWFCLKIMAGSKTAVDTSVNRVGRDLFLWTIRTNGGNRRMA